MGLRLDGEENVSTVMDRDYADPGRPRSSNHSRKNSLDKNHRIAGERGPNGTRPPIPVDKPLNVIVPNGNDSFENGHYPSSKGGYNHLLEEEFTKKALDVVHGHSSGSTPASSVLNSGPSTSSSVQNVLFNTPPRLGGRQEEMFKRRNIVEKIERMRVSGKLETFISQMDWSTPNQVTVNMRRYAKMDNPNFPDTMRNFILEGNDSPVASAKGKKNVPSSSKNVKMEDDGDATDYDDLEETQDRFSGPCAPSCSSTAQWLMERTEFLAIDAKISYAIEDTDQQIASLVKKLDDLESVGPEAMKEIMEKTDCEGGCARLIPWDGTRRRKLVKTDQYLLNSLPSTSKETHLYSSETVTTYSEQYLHRSSFMAPFHIRKNKSKSTWLNSKELEEEKMRNGVRKKEEKERREKRKMERADKEEEEEDKSDEYEDTDEDEDELPLPNHSRKNGAPKEKKRRRDRERKSARRDFNKSRRSSDCAPLAASRLSSVASRPSLDGEVDYHTPSFNHAHWLEQFKSQMPKNFTYNQIEVPECKKHVILKTESYRNENLDKYSTESMMRKIAGNHHQLEYEERRRFAVHPRGVRSRAQREESQGSGGSGHTPRPSEEGEEMEVDAVPSVSLSDPLPLPPPARKATTTAPPLPEFDYSLVLPVSDYERLSLEAPYERRTFAR